MKSLIALLALILSASASAQAHAEDDFYTAEQIRMMQANCFGKEPSKLSVVAGAAAIIVSHPISMSVMFAEQALGGARPIYPEEFIREEVRAKLHSELKDRMEKSSSCRQISSELIQFQSLGKISNKIFQRTLGIPLDGEWTPPPRDIYNLWKSCLGDAKDDGVATFINARVKAKTGQESILDGHKISNAYSYVMSDSLSKNPPKTCGDVEAVLNKFVEDVALADGLLRKAIGRVGYSL